MTARQQQSVAASADNWPFPAKPSVLVFDVNETLIDFESMTPLFERVFGDPRVMREWLGHLIMYSMTVTLSGLYVDYFTLGQGLLKMVGDIHGLTVSKEDANLIREGMLSMRAHPDAAKGLETLRDMPSLQAVAQRLSLRVPGTRCRSLSVHDGGRTRLGHRRRPKRRIQFGTDQAPGQRTSAGAWAAAAQHHRPGSGSAGQGTRRRQSLIVVTVTSLAAAAATRTIDAELQPSS
jgi:hypothetical protein